MESKWIQTVEKISIKTKQKDLVLLHGLFGSLSNWDNLDARFSQSYTIHSLELPLFQISAARNGLQFLVNFLEQYLLEHEIEKPVLVGNSLGGHIALLYTLQNPNKVSKLILTGSSGLYESQLGFTFFRMKDKTFVGQKVSEVFENREVVNQFLIDDVYDTLQNKEKSFALICIARKAQSHNLKEFLPQIKTKTLLIWGKQDKVTPPEVAEEFHQSLPNNELYWIDHCGHVPMMEQPEIFNEIVEKFLNEE